MNIINIQTFLCVAYNYSITKAARLLYVSQPTVSSRLQQLEDEVGAVLIYRKKGMRNIELTPNGAAFVPIAERWITLNLETEQFSKQRVLLPLTVACPDSLNIYLFNRLYRELVDDTTPLRLRFRTQQSPEIFSLVDNREADVGFAFHLSRYNNIICKPIFSERMLLLCSAAGNWPDEPISPDALDPSYELFLPWSPEIQRWHDYWWNPSIKPYVTVDTASFILNYMDNPKCWAVCPISVARAFLAENGRVVERELTAAPPDRVCHMLTTRPHKGAESPAIELFTGKLTSYISGIEWLNSINE